VRRQFRLALLLAACAPAALAQFQLSYVSAFGVQQVPPVLDFGEVNAGEALTVSFSLQNVSSAPATLNALALAGAGFTLPVPTLPVTLVPQGTFDFSATFQAAAPGSYSAVLRATGISVLLTATVLPALAYQVITAAGPQPLNGSLDFGTVTLGSSAVLRFSILNQNSQPLLIPIIAVAGADFSLSGASPSGTLLQPLASAAFAIAFTPSQAAGRSGSLTIGGNAYPLTGTGQAPPLPKASLRVTLAQPASAQQGSIAGTFDSAPLTSASGSVTMSFAAAAGIPSGAAADPAMTFAPGGQTAAFTAEPGSSSANFGGQPSAAFATGTTAGTLTFSLQFGGVTTQQTVLVAPAAVGFTAVRGTRESGALTVQATGFDNTRSGGKLTFTFYDSSGNAILPGAIASDATSNFASYFQSSALGGIFALTAVFPVTGSTSEVSAFEMSIANSVGSTDSGRTSF
jgi:hypothetical protein